MAASGHDPSRPFPASFRSLVSNDGSSKVPLNANRLIVSIYLQAEYAGMEFYRLQLCMKSMGMNGGLKYPL
jgi:hypothetical protein